MASLTVRQLDEKLKQRLRLRAARSGRSVEDEVRTILRSAAEEEAGTPDIPPSQKTPRDPRRQTRAADHRRRHRRL